MSPKIKFPHPGETIREDFLKPLGMSVNKLALELRVPATRMAEIAHGRRGISADTALRLARYFNTTPKFWLNLQASDVREQIASCGRGSESAVRKTNYLPSRDRRKRSY
jgi:addiction module HigA family antidote